MERKRLFVRLFPWFLFVTLAPLALVAAVAWKGILEFHGDRTREDLFARAALFRFSLEPLLSRDPGAVDRFCKQAARDPAAPDSAAGETRFTVIRSDGTVWGDTHEAPARMDNHRDRIEVQAALAGRPGHSERFSDTLRRPMAYVAIPLRADGVLSGALRVARPLDAVRAPLLGFAFRIGVMGLLTALLSAGIGLYAARSVAEPLEALERTAARFAAGDLKARAAPSEIQELAALGETLNRMADDLDERIRVETGQRREREAVLASMGEGVLAIDREQRILGVNAAAGRLLGVDPERARGRSVLDLIRNPDLQRFIERALRGDGGVEDDLTLYGPEPVSLQVRGSPLLGPDEQRIGAVVVLADVTRLRRLEAVRREFVANASHELRTPITSIRGFAETLTEGAATDPDAVRRFAGIIAAQARRLERLVADMLTLSRAEHLTEREGLALERTELEPLLRAAAAAAEPRAAARRIRLRLVCPAGVAVRAASALMEEAIVNLLDNAVTYSDEGGEIELRGALEAERVAIRVRDWGCGIEKRHLPRLFERFYRADHARSRASGGTGLGLAIVKHIVLAHGGEVAVSSEPGAGSEFTIRLPAA